MLTVALLSLVALLALAGLSQFWATRADARRFPPPGRRIDLGNGRRLHAKTTQSVTGAPAVVFESGISASSVNWTVIQPHVAEFAPTCSYDRAGLGWSDPPHAPFDANTLVEDLTALLDRLNLAQRYVLVGHSYGGLLVRLFAQRYPDRVAGLVLVDPVLACTWHHADPEHAQVRTKAIAVTRVGKHLARFGFVRVLTSPALLRKASYLNFLRSNRATAGPVARLNTELRKLPPELLPLVRSHWCRPQNFASMTNHLEIVPASFEGLQNQPVNYPIVVLTAADAPPEGVEEHRAIAALSPHGEHIVASRSGHWIQFDQPELIIQSIRSLVARTGPAASVK